MIAGPAGKAISRLIAGVVEIPAAYLDSFAQAIKDKTASRTVVNRAVTEAVAKFASSDDRVIQRAAHNLLAKEFRYQKNKEAIAIRTIEILNTPDPELPTLETPASVDDDWLNVFERYAQDASSERLQDLWARILAKQIRRPGAFSLRTMRVIAELDYEIAALFESYAPRVVSAHLIPHRAQSGPEFTDMLTLEDAGLISFSGGNLASNVEIQPGSFPFQYREHGAVIIAKQPLTLHIRTALLTKVGREVYSVLNVQDSIDIARAFVEPLPKDGIERIVYVKFITPRTPDLLGTFVADLWTNADDQQTTAPS